MDNYVNAKLSKWYDANEVLPLPNRIVIVKSKGLYSHGIYIGTMIATEDGYCLYPYFYEKGEDPLCKISDFVKWCYFQLDEE